MVRPLNRDFAPHYKLDSSHAGLWYDKFCDQWHSRWTLPAQQKAQWIKQVVSERPIGDRSLIEQHVDRQKDLGEKCLNGVCLRLQSESRFVTGLGREHPVENGFSWHPILGVPYLPGSSIKGLLRAWACNWEEDLERKPLLDAMLGAGETKNNEGGKVGAVIIFDALPTQPVRLEADVMTPHYNDYYQKGLAPGDWISPVPIPFLVVAAGTPFQFCFAPRTPAARKFLPIIESWLRAALQWLGAGAKTSIGYGRFVEAVANPAATQKQEQKSVKRPRHEKGEIITVTRIEDPKPKEGKSRMWFVADDGCGGVIIQGDPPDIQIGETVQLKVVASLSHGGYNFAVPKPK